MKESSLKVLRTLFSSCFKWQSPQKNLITGRIIPLRLTTWLWVILPCYSHRCAEPCKRISFSTLSRTRTASHSMYYFLRSNRRGVFCNYKFNLKYNNETKMHIIYIIISQRGWYNFCDLVFSFLVIDKHTYLVTMIKRDEKKHHHYIRCWSLLRYINVSSLGLP